MIVLRIIAKVMSPYIIHIFFNLIKSYLFGNNYQQFNASSLNSSTFYLNFFFILYHRISYFFESHRIWWQFIERCTIMCFWISENLTGYIYLYNFIKFFQCRWNSVSVLTKFDEIRYCVILCDSVGKESGQDRRNLIRMKIFPGLNNWVVRKYVYLILIIVLAILPSRYARTVQLW